MIALRTLAVNLSGELSGEAYLDVVAQRIRDGAALLGFARGILEASLIEAGDGAGDLWQAVAALPDKQRQAVAYHYVAGLAYAEIAAILGGTTDAARRAAADGVKNLRKNYPGATTEGRQHEHLT